MVPSSIHEEYEGAGGSESAAAQRANDDSGRSASEAHDVLSARSPLGACACLLICMTRSDKPMTFKTFGPCHKKRPREIRKSGQ